MKTKRKPNKALRRQHKRHLGNMRLRAAIESELQDLINAARPDSTVPDSVRGCAQHLAHALSWVLDSTVAIRPYETMAGCCCIGADLSQQPLREHCTLGPNKCLCPGRGTTQEEPPQ